jgi:hypothetical protein
MRIQPLFRLKAISPSQPRRGKKKYCQPVVAAMTAASAQKEATLRIEAKVESTVQLYDCRLSPK